jgi:molybdate transport system substrate-binding protein
MTGLSRRHAICGLAAVTASAASPTRVAAQAGPVIAAASSLNAALPEVARLFTAATGRSVRLSFGSSGAFTQQIENGAPFEVFLSADDAYVQRLAAAGRTVGKGALYADGRIGLFLPNGSRLRADPSLKDLGAAAGDGRLSRFAIANPDHAPYGRAAREALQSAGVWDAVRPKLVLGENVAQATQFATSGSAQGGVIPLSLALTPQVRAAGSFTLIPADRHRPLRQRAVLFKGASPTALAFYDFLQSPPARAVLRRHGFVLPQKDG